MEYIYNCPPHLNTHKHTHSLILHIEIKSLVPNSRNIEHVHLGPILLTWFNFISAWINNCIHYQVLDETNLGMEKLAHPTRCVAC